MLRYIIAILALFWLAAPPVAPCPSLVACFVSTIGVPAAQAGRLGRETRIRMRSRLIPQPSNNNNNSSKLTKDSNNKKSEPEPPKRDSDRSAQQDNEDDESGNRDDARKARRDVGLASDESDTAAPATVVDLFKKIFKSVAKPAVPAAVQAKHGIEGLGGREAGTRSLLQGSKPLDGVKHAVKPRAGALRRPVGNLKLHLPTFDSTEILARNVNSKLLKQAVSLGMQVQSTRSYGILDFTVTRLLVPPSVDAPQAKAMLQQLIPDAAVDLNRRYRLHPLARAERSPLSNEPATATGGCASDRCYGSAAIGWSGRLEACARNIRIGVIDTGIDSTHPALDGQAERINQGTIGSERRGTRANFHGTGVLALLAGDHRSSTPGLIPRAKFYVADIFFTDEDGAPVSTTLHLLEALELMDRLRVQIINLSLSGPKDALVQEAIAKMSQPRIENGVRRPGTIFVAAAGNGGPGAPPSYPAAYAQVLAVTAVGKDLRGYRRANQGDYIDVAAPGVDIWTALPNGNQGFQSGTSFAAPYVTAVVAAMYRSLPYRKSRSTILKRISVLDLGAPGRDRIYGRGLVQAPAACGKSSPWSPTVVSTRPRPARLSANH